MSKRLPGFENVRPPKPDMRDERVALAIARRIVDAVNLDDFYWTPDEKEDRAYETESIREKRSAKSPSRT